MFASLFDPPKLKAEKQMAKGAAVLRQQAANALQIEAKLLIQAIDHAEAIGDRSLASGAGRSAALGNALSEAGELIAHLEWVLHSSFAELEQETNSAIQEGRYDRLAKFEADLRDVFEQLTLRTRANLQEVNAASSAITASRADLEEISNVSPMDRSPRGNIEERLARLQNALDLSPNGR